MEERKFMTKDNFLEDLNFDSESDSGDDNNIRPIFRRYPGIRRKNLKRTVKTRRTIRGTMKRVKF